MIREPVLELWTSDGTADGTRLVRAVHAEPVMAYRRPINLRGDLVSVAADSAHGSELWILRGMFPSPAPAETPPEATSPGAHKADLQAAVGIALAAAKPSDSASATTPETAPADRPQVESEAPAPAAPPDGVFAPLHVTRAVDSDADGEEPSAALERGDWPPLSLGRRSPGGEPGELSPRGKGA